MYLILMKEVGDHLMNSKQYATEKLGHWMKVIFKVILSELFE